MKTLVVSLLTACLPTRLAFHQKKSCIAVFLVLAVQVSGRAEALSWTNHLGGNWTVAANWSPNRLPTAGDTVFITNSGSYGVTLNAVVTIAGLVVGGAEGVQTLVLSGNTLTLQGAGLVKSNAQWNLAGGVLAGPCVVSVAGTINWTSATLQGDAALSIAPGGILNLGGSGVKYMYGTITNAGCVRFADTGEWRFYGTTLHNLPEGLVDIQRDGGVSSYTGTPLIVNAGTLRKSIGTGTTTIGVRLINTGRIEAQTGTMALSSGGGFSSGTVFAGAGTNTLPGGTVSFDGEVTSENLVWNGAALVGQGTLSGAAVWTGGSLEAGASLTVATNGQIVLSGTGVKTLNGSLTNAGTFILGGAGDVRFNYSLLHNQPSGLVDLQGTGQLTLWSGNPWFINEGILRKSTGSGTSTFALGMLNSGRLEVPAGTLAFSIGGTFSHGTVFAGAGAVALTGGTAVFQGDLTSENLLWNGAGIAGTATIGGTVTWASGSLATGGILTVRTNSQLLLSGTGTRSLNGMLTNSGTITFTAGIWRFNNSLLHNLPGAVLDLPWDGALTLWSGTPTLVNEGLFRKSAGTGTATCTIKLINSATLEVASGALVCSGSSRLETGTLLTGAGTNLLASGTHLLAGHIRSENGVLAGATFSGDGSMEGSLDWLSGGIGDGGALTVSPDGLLRLLGTGIKTISGSLTNAGLVQWIGTGDWRLSTATIHNLPGGTFEARNNQPLTTWVGSPVVVNDGIFRKTASTGVTTVPQVFVNRGVMELLSGRAHFGTGFTNAAGTIRLAGGAFHLSRPLDLGGGVLAGFGTVSNAVVNNGRISPAPSGGALQILGEFTQTLAGELELWLAGTGPGTTHSQLVVSSNTALAGSLTVRLAEGFLPANGDNFNVLGFKRSRGDFQCRNGLFLLGNNLRLETAFSPTNLTLVATVAPDPTEPLLRVAADYPLGVACWPSEFTGWQLMACTDLLTGEWNVVPGVTNRLVRQPTAPAEFFRLRQ